LGSNSTVDVSSIGCSHNSMKMSAFFFAHTPGGLPAPSAAPMTAGGGWSNVVPILILNGVVWVALHKVLKAANPPEFSKRTKNDTEFNKYLHLRFNKAVQNPASVAGQAVKAGCAPEFRPFDSPANPVAMVYGWQDEIVPRPNPGTAASFDSRGIAWYQCHFSSDVVNDAMHDRLPLPAL